MLRRNLLQFLGSLPFLGLVGATNANSAENIKMEGVPSNPNIEYHHIYLNQKEWDRCSKVYKTIQSKGNVQIWIPLFNDLSFEDIDNCKAAFLSDGHKSGHAYLIWRYNDLTGLIDRMYGYNSPSPVYLVGVCFSPYELTPIA